MKQRSECISNLLLDIDKLDNMTEFKRNLYKDMYLKLIDYLLNPSDFSDYPKNSWDNSSEMLCVSHLYKNLTEHEILITPREFNIEQVLK